jgi:hypothetical protein
MIDVVDVYKYLRIGDHSCRPKICGQLNSERPFVTSPHFRQQFHQQLRCVSAESACLWGRRCDKSEPLDGAVIDFREGRTAKSMSWFYRDLTPLQRHSIQRGNMDMWPACVSAARLWLADADSKICFDRFNVMKLILDGLDKVRHHEHEVLRSNG